MKQCAICKKKGVRLWQRKKLRSKYNPTVKKRKKPNLQWMKIKGKRILVCTKCQKATFKFK